MNIKVVNIVGMSLLTKRPSGQYCRNGSDLFFRQVVNIAGMILLSLKKKGVVNIIGMMVNMVGLGGQHG